MCLAERCTQSSIWQQLIFLALKVTYIEYALVYINCRVYLGGFPTMQQINQSIRKLTNSALV